MNEIVGSPNSEPGVVDKWWKTNSETGVNETVGSPHSETAPFELISGLFLELMSAHWNAPGIREETARCTTVAAS